MYEDLKFEDLKFEDMIFAKGDMVLQPYSLFIEGTTAKNAGHLLGSSLEILIDLEKVEQEKLAKASTEYLRLASLEECLATAQYNLLVASTRAHVVSMHLLRRKTARDEVINQLRTQFADGF